MTPRWIPGTEFATTEMVERVARAIAKATGDDPDKFWDVWVAEARAAIEAMREATDDQHSDLGKDCRGMAPPA